MTAAQKKNVERFKKAAEEAKKLRKKNPKLTQAQAVKQAFAILYKTGKVSGAKKTATKKPARKKATAKSYHKDTKSHNVRISVVSGVKKKIGYSKERIQAHKELTKAIKSQPKELFPYTKKETIIKAGKKYFTEMAKKHSVSGVKNLTHWTEELLRLQATIAMREGALEANVNMYKYGGYPAIEKKQIKKNIVTLKKQISDLKKHLTSVKKHIK